MSTAASIESTRHPRLGLVRLTMLLPMLAVAAVAAGPSSRSVRAGDEAERTVRIEQAIDVAPVWSGHYVDFALLAHVGKHVPSTAIGRIPANHPSRACFGCTN
jgi:hypothetical protein